MVIVVMGVCGCGKSTVGELLAEKLGYPYYDADAFHPKENIDKMASGQPLDDNDRKPWLMRLNEMLKEADRTGEYAVLACSALKQIYRDMLSDGIVGCCFVYLKGDYEIIHGRMMQREGHYMGARMLQSQFDALEEPTDALTVNIENDPETIVADLITRLKKGDHGLSAN